MSTDGPVLDTLTDMTAASVAHNSLTPREFMISRLAAMVAVDAPPISYFVSASAFEESGLTTEDIQGVMIAVAPVDRKSTRLNSSHSQISYAVFCLKKKK